MKRLYAGQPHNFWFRSGLARDQLIFVIICSVAVGVAAVAMTLFFLGGRGKLVARDWQCLKCEYAFSSKTLEPLPIDCPQCGGQAVRLIYKNCPKCGEKVLVRRMRMTPQGQAMYEAQTAQR